MSPWPCGGPRGPPGGPLGHQKGSRGPLPHWRGDLTRPLPSWGRGTLDPFGSTRRSCERYLSIIDTRGQNLDSVSILKNRQPGGLSLPPKGGEGQPSGLFIFFFPRDTCSNYGCARGLELKKERKAINRKPREEMARTEDCRLLRGVP